MVMKRMLKAFVIVACLQVVLVSAKRPDFVTDEIMEMLAGDKSRCMAEHGTTEDMIEKASNGDLQDDKAITCYMYCMFDAFSLVDEDGELEIEMMVGFVPEELQDIANELIEKCARLPGSDPCNKMYVRAKCIMDSRPDLWFMV